MQKGGDEMRRIPKDKLRNYTKAELIAHILECYQQMDKLEEATDYWMHRCIECERRWRKDARRKLEA